MTGARVTTVLTTPLQRHDKRSGVELTGAGGGVGTAVTAERPG
ncbi:hypothetical protein GCM10010275_53510 [Streptomyces litmocidini]|nr:hypothetical protein [Streptomyces litmocidini]GGV06703.1 hypothetical protein GCM10010275_53510 [Streptomyces litmocidini]